MRSPERVVVTSRDVVLFVDPAGETLRHPTGDAQQWSDWLQALAHPRSGREIGAAQALPADLDEALLARLVASGHVLTADQPETLRAAQRRPFVSAPGFHLEPTAREIDHLVIGCTGSVVAGMLPATFLSLAYSGFQAQLDVILTPSAERFLTRDLLESYGIRTWSDAFERREGVRVPHVQLAASAGCILVLPATARTLSRLAQAACDDLLSLCVVASSAPIVVSPAMNDVMWRNAGVRRNVQTLRADGMFVIEPTIIFGAADFSRGAQPMFGGHGALWSGPRGLMKALQVALAWRRGRQSTEPGAL